MCGGGEAAVDARILLIFDVKYWARSSAAKVESLNCINLYSPTSGSKEKTYIQTCKYGEKQQKAKEKTVSKCRLHAIMLLHAIIQ